MRLQSCLLVEIADRVENAVRVEAVREAIADQVEIAGLVAIADRVDLVEYQAKSC